MSAPQRTKLEHFENALRAHAGGAELADAFAAHIEEVVALVNGNRRVAVVWQRNQGPAFVRAAMEGAPHHVTVPSEVSGISLETLLLRMADALQRHGSPELRRAIADRSLQVLRWARECRSFEEVLADLDARGERKAIHG